MNKKILIVSPGAGGKSNLLKYLVNKGLYAGVSFTTRPPREGEVNGVDYYFVPSENAFKAGVELNQFLEYENFNGWFYGTNVKEWNRKKVFTMTPSGIKKLSIQQRSECIVVYLDIPEEIRRERLKQRKDADSPERRIEADRKDFADLNIFDIRITNPYYDSDKVYELIKLYDEI